MPAVLFNKTRRTPDQFLRCVLTLSCNGNCPYCSALISEVPAEVRKIALAPEIWAAGINERRLPVIFTGGEPFLYKRLVDLVNMLDPKISLSIYTNLQQCVKHYVESVTRPVSFVVSLHPSTVNFNVWYERVKALQEYNPVGITIVGTDDWRSLSEFLLAQKDLSSFTISADQRKLARNGGLEINSKYPEVDCSGKIYQYGPDGYRYICIKLMGLNSEHGRFEHISEPMTNQLAEVTNCPHFGFCAACSNLVEGTVTSR